MVSSLATQGSTLPYSSAFHERSSVCSQKRGSTNEIRYLMRVLADADFRGLGHEPLRAARQLAGRAVRQK